MSKSCNSCTWTILETTTNELLCTNKQGEFYGDYVTNDVACKKYVEYEVE